ncbi:MAG: A/G-specific adenine glycosylase [Gemmataceae bacterium]|nr:A/G-specific adenine glycosylase [Gemmataceae bacterium]
MLLDRSAIRLLRRRLLAWFDRSRRDLPWRRDRDPYRIWVSEVMLQQTTVPTVARRFESFLARFPTLGDLARAEESDVLQAWQGLGYYRRARHLHAAAKKILRDHDGKFPDQPGPCRELPGMGPYLVNAVLSQAFERRLPILEANTQRLYCRLLNEAGDPTTASVRQRLLAFAESLLPDQRVGDFNQALMELGALVCLPGTPDCSRCPLADFCQARRAGTQAVVPLTRRRSPIERREEIALVVWRRDRALLLQRPENGRWPLLWEFPRASRSRDESSEETAVRAAKQLAGIDVRLRRRLGIVRYSVLREHVTVECWEAQWRRGQVSPSWHLSGRWLPIADWPALPCSSPQRRLALLASQGGTCPAEE